MWRGSWYNKQGPDRVLNVFLGLAMMTSCQHSEHDTRCHRSVSTSQKECPTLSQQQHTVAEPTRKPILNSCRWEALTHGMYCWLGWTPAISSRFHFLYICFSLFENVTNRKTYFQCFKSHPSVFAGKILNYDFVSRKSLYKGYSVCARTKSIHNQYFRLVAKVWWMYFFIIPRMFFDRCDKNTRRRR